VWGKYTSHVKQVNRKTNDFKKLISKNSAVWRKLIVTLDLIFVFNHLNFLAGHRSTTDLVEVTEDLIFHD